MLLNNDIGENITITKSDEKCTIYKIHDNSGDGTMTCYNVLPGIKLLYNDFHMQRCFSNFQPQEDMIGIDYCYEGRIEWKINNSSYLYLQQGDLQITSKDNHSREFAFPTGYYQGITIAIYIEKAKKILDSSFAEFTIDINNLGRKFCTLKKPFIIHAEDYIRHIFLGVYAVPDKICIPYFKVKVLELLLILNTIDLSGSGKELPYFSKEHVEAVKSIKELITEHIEQHFTLAELSSRFGIPLTSMKNCFKRRLWHIHLYILENISYTKCRIYAA